MGEIGTPVGLGKWLEETCRRERLSLRQAGAKAGLSHGAIADIIRGASPSAGTIKKLARGFGEDGGLALEDRLLELAGYRTPRSLEESKENYIEIIPLLSGEHQHIIKVLVEEMVKTEGVSSK